MQLLPVEQMSQPVRSLFEPLSHGHLALACILAGRSPGKIYADDADLPTVAIAWFHTRVFAAGDAGNPTAPGALSTFISNQLVAEMLAVGTEGFVVHAEPGLIQALSVERSPAAELPLPGRAAEWIPATRQHYSHDMKSILPAPALPPGYRLVPVDRRLLAQPKLGGLDWLRDEMVSERPSVDDFLQNSFGVALLYGDEIAGWCLSEYNGNLRCEVGVAVAEAHQRKGLGTALTLALLQEASGRGYQEVGWHCWTRNAASGALARRSGFHLQQEFPVILCLLSEQAA